jgi:hypothetical protein
MRKFGNTADKVNVILSVFREGEKLKGKEIVDRIKSKGYKVNDNNIKMFIYYNMLYEHLRKEEVKGVNRYFMI